MKKSVLIILLMAFFMSNSNAQDVGIKEYPYLGIQFTIPQGWFGRETEIGYMLGSNSEPGFVLLLTHEAKTLDALKREASNGIKDDNGTSLQLTGAIDSLGDKAVGGTFEVVIEFQPAKSYIAAVLNPFGQGVMIMAATSKDSFTYRYAELARQVGASLKFAHPKESPVATEWKDSLKGAKLTYMKTTGGSDYSGYSGTSSRSEFILCSNQQFSYYSSNSSSFDINAGFGSSNSSNSGQGRWEVATGGDGSALLKMQFNDGREFE